MKAMTTASHAKRLSAVLLAAALLVGLAGFTALARTTSAFADTGSTDSTDTTTGSITIENAENGAYYYVYKVFDLTYGQYGYSTSYTFTNTNDNTALFETLNGGNSPFTLTQQNSSDVYEVTIKEDTAVSSIVSFLKSLTTGDNAVLKPTATLQATETSKTIGNLPLGYYYVATSTGGIVSLGSTSPTATVIDKNIIPFTKTVDDGDLSVQLGQTLTFTITTQVPDYESFAKGVSFTITDTLSAGLTFDDSSMEVTIAGEKITDGGITQEVTKNEDGTTTVVFSFTKITQRPKGETIVLTYKATVNDKAVSVVSTNNAVLKYSNDPSNSSSYGEESSSTKVYTAKIIIDKYSAGDATTDSKLSGAEFVLYKVGDNGITYYWRQGEEGTPDDKVTWTSDLSQATKVTTDSGGAASFEGLEDGTYYLQEITAPEGYNLLTTAIEVKIDGQNSLTSDTGDTSSLTHTAEVANTPSSQLPGTGGMGTGLLYMIGIIMVVGAGITLVIRRRIHAGKDIE